MQDRSVNCGRHQASASISRRCGCLFFGFKVAEMMPLVVDVHVRYPFACGGVPRDATVTRATRTARHVLGTFRRAQDAQIPAPIIERVAVDVVSEASIAPLEPQQFSVQLDAIPPNRIATSRRQVPRPLPDPFRIGGVDDRVRGDGPITTDQRHARRQSVIADFDRPGVLREVAEAGAEHPLSHKRPLPLERRAARLADKANLVLPSGILAGSGAVPASAGGNRTRRSKELTAAVGTNQRDARRIVPRHRKAHPFGVIPPAVHAARGLLLPSFYQMTR